MNLLDQLTVTTGSTDPIYRQLADQVRRLLAGGQLKVGDQMPSVRDLAGALAVNPMTVAKAFGVLEAEGALARRRGLSMVVSDHDNREHSTAARLDMLRPALEAAAHQARQLSLTTMIVLSFFGSILSRAKVPAGYGASWSFRLVNPGAK